MCQWKTLGAQSNGDGGGRVGFLSFFFLNLPSLNHIVLQVSLLGGTVMIEWMGVGSQ